MPVACRLFFPRRWETCRRGTLRFVLLLAAGQGRSWQDARRRSVIVSASGRWRDGGVFQFFVDECVNGVDCAGRNVAGRSGFLNAHHWLVTTGPVLVQGAPESSHSLMTAISFAGKPPPTGGIRRTSPLPETALYRRLSADLPGTMAGPRVPPFRAFSREVSFRPDVAASPWQVRHRCWRIVTAAPLSAPLAMVAATQEGGLKAIH